ncbi:hypothetical protein [Janthinobacterium violaceinigrum]|uniref:Uncharacterized protein n=1 Tax=Janthinobacterium violaceinigrum TaxID=2654252 RepID=A0A6I1HNC1_9BURK|nr:hypothetical protein [Janthinobacterium violaceinigrum]KAB8060104.1 hypothetical protein GCN75_25590 [Janthinobacterium violaceinigrum]
MDDFHGLARQLDGYLQAVSALKDDGSDLLCSYLGPVAPQAALDAVCRTLDIRPDGLRLLPLEQVVCSGGACTPRQWLLERLRPMSEADRQPLDARLYDGFVRELAELLGSEPHWYQLVSSGQHSLAGQLGAIWSVFVFGIGGHAYVMHCSWDS